LVDWKKQKNEGYHVEKNVIAKKKPIKQSIWPNYSVDPLRKLQIPNTLNRTPLFYVNRKELDFVRLLGVSILPKIPISAIMFLTTERAYAHSHNARSMNGFFKIPLKAQQR
jgi:hypothetical protein